MLLFYNYLIVWLHRSLVPFNGVGSEFVGDVRGNYLSNNNIDDHMNLQLTFGGQEGLSLKAWKGKQRIYCKLRIGLQRDKWSIWLNDYLLFTVHVQIVDWSIVTGYYTWSDHYSLIDRLLLITVWSNCWLIDNSSTAIFKRD